MNINNAIQLALQHYQSGNLQHAEHLYKKILKKHPGSVATLHFLGIIYYRLGNHDLAISYIKRELELNSNDPDAYNNIGLALHAKGKINEAITYYQKAININPNLFYIYFNLGNVFKDGKQLQEAITAYRKALQLNSNFAEAYNNLGIAYQEKGQINEAITYYQKALHINPNLANTYNNLGFVLYEKGQIDDSIYYCQKALQLNPHLIDAYNNMGNALGAKKKFDEAITYYEKALKLNPKLINVYYNLGNALKQQSKIDEAIAAYNKALTLEPSYFLARWARCISHLPIIYKDQLSIQIIRKQYSNDLIKLRDTVLLESGQDIQYACEAIGSHQPFLLACQELNDKELQQIYGGFVCRIMALKYPEFALLPTMPHYHLGDPIRVGMVSGYFRSHSVWKLFRGWVENVDKGRFVFFGYHTGRTTDQDTKEARHCFTRFVEDIYSFEELCRIIRKDDLHVLIYPEIGMDPTTVRLAALKLAPVQCLSWGHPDTSGLPTIDYYLSSDLMEPTDADEHYSEKLIRLPNLSIYYTPIDAPEVAISRDMFKIRPQSILYFCCQSLHKYLPQYDEIYPQIAQRLADCQFLFISNPSTVVTEQFRLRIKNTFDHFNMSADDYVIFLPYLDTGQYHAMNCLVDIYLDSIGWSGGNTTLEAIACNLPVVTMHGKLMRGRHSAAILTMMGMTETIAKTLDEYIELAVKLGKDSDWRQYISEKIKNNKHLVYRDRTCITALEDFLQRVVNEELR